MRDYKLANQLAQQKQSWIIANIGNLQKNPGFYREAIEHLQQALKIAPEDQYALDRLATSIRLRDEEEKTLSNIIKEAKQDIVALQVSTHAEDSNSG